MTACGARLGVCGGGATSVVCGAWVCAACGAGGAAWLAGGWGGWANLSADAICLCLTHFVSGWAAADSCHFLICTHGQGCVVPSSHLASPLAPRMIHTWLVTLLTRTLWLLSPVSVPVRCDQTIPDSCICPDTSVCITHTPGRIGEGARTAVTAVTQVWVRAVALCCWDG